jgi:hypothetical protein
MSAHGVKHQINTVGPFRHLDPVSLEAAKKNF